MGGARGKGRGQRKGEKSEEMGGADERGWRTRMQKGAGWLERVDTRIVGTHSIENSCPSSSKCPNCSIALPVKLERNDAQVCDYITK